MDQILPRPTAFDLAPARLTIDLKAIVANWRMLADLSGAAETSAVVKADAYGLGAAPVARALVRAGCKTFFVATADEGVALRSVAPGARIFVLSGFWTGQEADFIAADLTPVLSTHEQVAAFLAMGRDHGFALNFDTGMNRLGFGAQDAGGLAGMGRTPALVMSHLACSDMRSHPMNETQRETFQAIAQQFPGIAASLASSGGIFLGSDHHFDLTRPGIALYGDAAVDGEANPMHPVLHAEARILQIRQAAKGDFVSYGATQKLSRDSRLAIIGAGYADGWHRSMSGSGVALRDTGSAGGCVMIAGCKAPVIGRITMDLTILDVTDLRQGLAQPGGYATLIGNGLAPEDAAQAAGTISYELLTSLGRRYERRYV